MSEIPYGYCHCGCGGKTNIAPHSDPRYGHVKGEPYKFISQHHNNVIVPKMTAIERFWSKVAVTKNHDDCWLWQAGLTHSGYGQFSLGGRKGKHIPAHRYSYTIANGEIPSGLFVCHRCDNPLCVNPNHLFVGTHVDNVQDMVSKGRQQKAERHGNRKLTVKQVQCIRDRYAQGGITLKELGDEFGVSEATISLTVRRIHWKSVE